LSKANSCRTKSFPGNFQKKYQKVVSSLCGVQENYLTNEGIGAIVQAVSGNPGRYSTVDPDEVMYGDHRPRISERAGFCAV
jgi:hypothetical protein